MRAAGPRSRESSARRESEHGEEEEMNKTHARICVGASTFVAVLGVASATTAARTTASVARGHFSFATDFTEPLHGGDNAEIAQFTYKGALTGVSIDYGTQTVHSNGSFQGRGTEYCANCTIRGRAGAFIATFAYSGSGVTYTGHLKFTRGFGKLAGLRGGGTFKGNVSTNANTYAYDYTLP
jgi:hypothetical protein